MQTQAPPNAIIIILIFTTTTLQHLRLPLEHNQIRVQRNRQQRMTRHTKRQREDRHKRINPPHLGHSLTRQQNHANHKRTAKRKRILEPLQHTRNLLEKGKTGGFFGRGAPLHVDAEEVGEQGLGDVQRDAAEEDGQ